MTQPTSSSPLHPPQDGPKPLDPKLAKRKLTYRTARFLAWERLARLSPWLARRNNFPLGALTLEEASGALLEQREPIDVAAALGPVPEDLARILRRIGVDPTLRATARILALRAEDAVLMGHTGAVHQAGRMIAPPSLKNWPKSAKPAGLKTLRPEPGRLSIALATAPAGAKHFFHGFMDRFCPLILMLERLFPEAGLNPGDADVWVNSRRAPFHDAFHRFAEARWPGLRFRHLEKDERLAAPEILMPLLEQDPVPRSWAPAPFYAVMSDFAEAVAGPPLARPGRRDRKIFIDRSDAAKRVLLNADEISALLARRGYEVLTPGRMPYAAQVRAFSEASHIVATHGAALMNLIAAPAHARVLEMFVAETWADDFPNATASYILLCRARGLDHRAWTCAEAADRRFSHRIDPDALEAQLDALEA
ncbi:MAG: glycosyltransferase family 61 protein [Pseudomonadota bacterium]